MKWSMSEELARAQRELDERKLRHNAVTAADAVVSRAARGFSSGFLKALGLFVLLVILCNAAQDVPGADNTIQICAGILMAGYLIYWFVRAAVKGR